MTDKSYEIREMTIEDYDDVFSFWESSNGLRLDESDSKKIKLKRKP